MNIDLILNATLPVKIHLATIIVAIVLTLAILTSRKGSRAHKTLGWICVVVMAVTSLTSFYIREINPNGGLSLIHLLSIITLVALVIGVYAARKHDRKTHQRAMLSIVIGGLLIAGLFAFSPGRLLYEVLFS